MAKPIACRKLSASGLTSSTLRNIVLYIMYSPCCELLSSINLTFGEALNIFFCICLFSSDNRQIIFITAPFLDAFSNQSITPSLCLSILIKALSLGRSNTTSLTADFASSIRISLILSVSLIILKNSACMPLSISSILCSAGLDLSQRLLNRYCCCSTIPLTLL